MNQSTKKEDPLSAARIVSATLSAAILAAAYFGHRFLVSDDIVNGNLSYIASVASIMALVIAIGEIRHATTNAKAINNGIQKALRAQQERDFFARKGECHSLLQQIISCVRHKQYDRAHAHFQSYRALRRAGLDSLKVAHEQVLWDDVEERLETAMQTNLRSPLSSAQLSTLRDVLRNMTSKLELDTFEG